MQHFLGLSGISEISFCTNENKFLLVTNIFPIGPHIKPVFLNTPNHIYNPQLNKKLIGIENKKRSLIYQ